jgi:Protein of unknown function (DUF982)
MKTSKERRQEFGKVLVRDGAIKSPVQALLVLLTMKDSAARQHAVHACRLAVDNRIPPNKARDAFLRAAQEAGVLAQEQERLP